MVIACTEEKLTSFFWSAIRVIGAIKEMSVAKSKALWTRNSLFLAFSFCGSS